MSVARGPERPSATQHAFRLSRFVVLGRHAGSHPSCALCGMPGARRARSQPHRRHHRQPKRKKRRKRGACIDPHGYDAGKKIKGKKRHILVDTLGLLLHVIVHPADIQDRDGGILLLATLFGMYPFLRKLFADGGYQGPELQKALTKIMPTSKLKSSSAPITPKDLSSYHAVGWSSVPLLGSTDADGLPKIGRTSIARRSHSCASHPSASCSENFVIQLDVPGRTLNGSRSKRRSVPTILIRPS